MSETSWLDQDAWNLALFLVVIAVAVLGAIAAARGGRRFYLRPLPAVEAIGEIIGRATEMGRPVFYIAGTRDLDDVQTLASLAILDQVGAMTARKQCRLVMPTDRSLVLAAAREVLRDAYAAAGRPDGYSDDLVTYVSDDQFGFAARVGGVIAREEPGACLLLGSFFAESLLIAESGNQAGAVQVAGTAMSHQLPFLVAACDHVLIGEEFFAASAYLTGDPTLCGSLRGQDFLKYLVMALVTVGALCGIIVAVTDWAPAAVLFQALLRLLETR